MRRTRSWRLVVALVVAMSACVPVFVSSASTASAAEADASAAHLWASFDRGARLGGATALRFGLRVDPKRLPSPVSELRVRYPSSLGIATSGLGVATCRPPTVGFTDVMVELTGLAGCSTNSVMGYGTLRARLRMGRLTVPADASITMLAGPVERDRMHLVAFVDGVSPFGVKLLYGGALQPAPPPFGEDLSVRFPAIPTARADASFALLEVRLEIGSRAVVYRDEAGRRYRPDGITLPTRCPAAGFRFAAELAFQDGRRATATATVPCPRRPPR